MKKIEYDGSETKNLRLHMIDLLPVTKEEYERLPEGNTAAAPSGVGYPVKGIYF